MKIITQVKVFYDGSDTMENDANEFLKTLNPETLKGVFFQVGNGHHHGAILIQYMCEVKK